MLAPRNTNLRRRFRLAMQIALLVFFLVVIIYASFKFAPSITRLVRQPDKFRAYLRSFGPLSALIYVVLSALQIIVAVIPGEIVQVAGGYAFGTPLGALFAVIGTVIGTLVVFAAVRLLGYSLVKAVVPAAQFDKFNFLINNPKSEIAIFVLFLIPGIPKDALVYLSGLTPIKPFRFLLVCTIARFPGILGSAYIGAHLQRKDYISAWIMFGIAAVLFIAGVLLRSRIFGWLQGLRRVKKEPPTES